MQSETLSKVHAMTLVAGERPALGQMYNAYENKFDFDAFLYPPQYLKPRTDPIPADACTKSWSATQISTASDVSKALDISGEVHVAILAGLISLKGAGEYSTSSRSQTKNYRAIIRGQVRGRLETIDTAELERNHSEHRNALPGAYTHYVSSIQYGADVLFDCECSANNLDRLSVVNANGALQTKFLDAFASIKASAQVRNREQESTTENSVKVTISADSYFGDFRPVRDLQEAENLFNAISTSKQDPESLLPKVVWLREISRPDSVTRTVHAIDDSLINSALKAYTSANRLPNLWNDLKLKIGRGYAGSMLPGAKLAMAVDDHVAKFLQDLRHFSTELGNAMLHIKQEGRSRADELQAKISAIEHLTKDSTDQLLGLQRSADHEATLRKKLGIEQWSSVTEICQDIQATNRSLVLMILFATHDQRIFDGLSQLVKEIVYWSNDPSPDKMMQFRCIYIDQDFNGDNVTSDVELELRSLSLPIEIFRGIREGPKLLIRRGKAVETLDSVPSPHTEEAWRLHDSEDCSWGSYIFRSLSVTAKYIGDLDRQGQPYGNGVLIEGGIASIGTFHGRYPHGRVKFRNMTSSGDCATKTVICRSDEPRQISGRPFEFVEICRVNRAGVSTRELEILPRESFRIVLSPDDSLLTMLRLLQREFARYGLQQVTVMQNPTDLQGASLLTTHFINYLAGHVPPPQELRMKCEGWVNNTSASRRTIWYMY